MVKKALLNLNTNVKVPDAGIQSPRAQVPIPHNEEIASLQSPSIDRTNDIPAVENSSITSTKVGDTNDKLGIDNTSKNEDPKVNETRKTQPNFITQVTPDTPQAAPTIPNLITQTEKETVQKPHTKATEKKSIWRIFCCWISNNEPQPTVKTEEPIAQPNAVYLINKTGLEVRLLPSPLDYKKCLVLDLDETLVHSSFKPVEGADFTIDVEIDQNIYTVFVLKRPKLEEFLEAVGGLFEVVVFTASLAKYADPVLDVLDPKRIVKHRLFRDSCVQYRGNYVKDLSLLGRDLKKTLIIDNSPICYMFHPQNAIAITSWFDDPEDHELMDLIPYLTEMSKVDDVTAVVNKYK